MPSPALPSPDLLKQLEALSRGEVSVAEVARRIGIADGDLHSLADVEGARVDLGRRERCGFGEVVYGEGKSAELIISIVQTQLDAGQTALVTRLDPTTAAQVRRAFEHCVHHPQARTLRIDAKHCRDDLKLDDDSADEPVHVAVATAGSTDGFVADEAIETLTWMGIPHRRFDDIGVAGPARLLAAVPRLREATAIVVVAGMEGALPAALAGHVSVPVFAVPTSVGYGANLGGLTPLLGMLSSCAANVAVVNVDAGFKGGYLAGLVVDQVRRAVSPRGRESE